MEEGKEILTLRAIAWQRAMVVDDSKIFIPRNCDCGFLERATPTQSE